MGTDRPTRPVIAGHVVGLFFVLVGIVLDAPASSWAFARFGILLGFSIFSDLTATDTGEGISISGSFLALVLSMVFLGGAPAALIGLMTMIVGWLRWHEETHFLIHNLLNYSLFPLIGGIVFHAIYDNTALENSDPGFYVL